MAPRSFANRALSSVTASYQVGALQVVPRIEVESPIVMALTTIDASGTKKEFSKAPRIPIILKADIPFDGIGTLTRSGEVIDLYTKVEGGEPLAFDGTRNAFAGMALVGGVTLYAVAKETSKEVGDVTLTLELKTRSGVVLGKPAEVKLSAVNIEFFCSERMRYGYDDMDNEAGQHHHISLKEDDWTVVGVAVHGPLVEGAWVFTSSDMTVVEVDSPKQSKESPFDLRINGKSSPKASGSSIEGKTSRRTLSATSAEDLPKLPPAFIEARIGREDGPIVAKIEAHVYKERRIEVLVVRIQDRRKGSTPPREIDGTMLEDFLNKVFRPVVVKFEVQIHKEPVVVSLADESERMYISASISSDDVSWVSRLPETDQTIMGIVKDTVSRYPVIDAVNPGPTQITIRSIAGMHISTGARGWLEQSSRHAKKRNGCVVARQEVTVENVMKKDEEAFVLDITPSDSLVDCNYDYFFLDLLGVSSDDGIYVDDDNDRTRLFDTIAHELGHYELKWADLDAPGNLMHASASTNTGSEIRYKPQKHISHDGSDCQWELVLRP